MRPNYATYRKIRVVKTNSDIKGEGEMKKLLCFILGHKPVKKQKKDMFGYEYVWQKSLL